jgi:WD40 repeat protein
VFDTRNGRVIQASVAGLGGAPALAYRPDGSLLAAGTADGVRLLDGRSGALRGVLGPATELISSLAFSPDGSRLAVITQTQAEVWSLSRRTVLILEGKPFPASHARTSMQPGMHGAVFTHDGASIAVAGDNGVRVFSVRTGALLRTLPGTSPASAIAVSPDGRRLAIASMARLGSGAGVVSLWSTWTWRRAATLAEFPGRQVTAVGFSADGASVGLGAADGSAGLWSVRTHDQEAAYVGSTTRIAAIAFAGNDSQVATASADGTRVVPSWGRSTRAARSTTCD